MRITVVPAQITTVEDRVAGNFTFVQIVLMIIPLVIGALIYSSMAPKIHFNPAKLTLIAIDFFIFGIMAIRFNGKILADWMIIYLRYSVRPRRYIFTKNDLIHRDMILETAEENHSVKTQTTKNISKKQKALSLLEQSKMDQLFAENALSVSFKISKKGGVDVSLKQTES
jgi:hypothetical protein